MTTTVLPATGVVNRHDAGILRLVAVRAGVVGERDVGGQPVERQQAVDARAGGLYPFEFWRALAQPFLRRARIDHEVRGFQRGIEDVAVPADRHAELFGECAMALLGGFPEILGDMKQSGTLAEAFEVEV
jgi:hypothetical protein